VPYDEIALVHPALDLVNSQHGTGPDLLDDEAWFADYLTHWGYAPAGRPGGRGRARLVALRALLRQIVEALAEGETPSKADVGRLNVVLRAGRVARELVPLEGAFHVRLAPARRDWRWVLSEIAASFAELVAGGDTDRIKVCDNRDCRFAFYDASKNRSRRWCAQTTCGNRHKVQQFRARQRARAQRPEKPQVV
jgi:predicted RNA-binding Zn ribbon-like protein